MKPRVPMRIAGTGTYVPDRVIDNAYFTQYLDTTDEWIKTRSGIRERRYAAGDQYTSTLAAHAARTAMEDAGVDVKDIDLVIVATATGDCQFPGTVCFMQRELGMENIPGFDLSAACAGFVYATSTAANLIGSGSYKRILVVGAETLSRFADPEDRTTIVLFGDAAGAAVIEAAETENQGVLYCELGTDPTKAEHIWVPAGGSRLKTSETTVAERLHFMRMKGREVYKFAVMKLAELIDRALQESKLAPDDLKLVIPHQSNLRIIESARDRLGLTSDKVSVNIDRYGNTSAASIPMALDEARRDGKLKTGDHVLMIAIGAGLTWGVMVVRL